MINLSNLNIDNSIPFYVIHYNKSIDRKKSILSDGPNDFKVTDKELTKVYKLFDELIKKRN